MTATIRVAAAIAIIGGIVVKVDVMLIAMMTWLMYIKVIILLLLLRISLL